MSCKLVLSNVGMNAENNVFDLAIENLENGLYMVQVSDANGLISTNRLLKN